MVLRFSPVSNIPLMLNTRTSIIFYQLHITLEINSSFIDSFIPLTCAECDVPLLFLGASSIPLCYIPFPSTLFEQLFFHPPSLHLAIYFLVHLSVLLFPNSYTILFWEFYFLPFSVHAQTNIIYLTLLSAIEGFLTTALISLWVNILQFSFSLHILGLKFFYTLSLQKCSVAFSVSLSVSRFLMQCH